MLSSMTGYGRSTCQIGQQELTVEFKSVNHRYLDLTIHLPNDWLFLEDSIKRYIQSVLKRGKVTGYLTLKGMPGANQTVSVNWAVFDRYQNAITQLKGKLGGQEVMPLDLSQWLAIPNLFQAEEMPLNVSDFEPSILKTVQEAIQHLLEMRQKEGVFLRQEIENRLLYIRDGLEQMERRSPELVVTYQNRLEERIRDLLADRVVLDEARIINEVAIFAEKTDITEEMARLKSHLHQFTAILDREEPIGRQLDFLIQEMNREINTMGSKSPDVAITQTVVALKGEVEKIREQVQNIE